MNGPRIGHEPEVRSLVLGHGHHDPRANTHPFVDADLMTQLYPPFKDMPCLTLTQHL